MATEILTMDQIEASKVYISDADSLSFRHPSEYLDRYMTILNGINGVEFSFRGDVGGRSKEKENEEFEEQEEYISYKRLIARAKLPIDFDINVDSKEFNHLTTEIGYVFSLEGKSPEMRAYRGRRVTICDNGCIFGADAITTLNLARSSTDAIYRSLDTYAEFASSDLEQYKRKIEILNEKKLSGSALKQRIGEIVWGCKQNNKLGITCATDMVAYLQDNKSKYALQGDTTTEWMLYNACTESLKKSSILDEMSKVKLLEGLFNYN